MKRAKNGGQRISKIADKREHFVKTRSLLRILFCYFPVSGIKNIHFKAEFQTLLIFQIDFIFLEQFWVHSKIEQKSTESSSHNPLPPLHPTSPRQHPLLESNIYENQRTSLTHLYHSFPTKVPLLVVFSVHSWCCTFYVHAVGLDKYILTCTCHYSIIQNSSTALRFLWVPFFLGSYATYPELRHSFLSLSLHETRTVR